MKSPPWRFVADVAGPVCPGRRRWRLGAVGAALLGGLLLAGPTRVAGAEQDWVGRSRAEVEQVLGKPQSSLHRGETEILMFAGGVKVEVRDDAVVSFRGNNQAVIVTRDGTRYSPTEQGRVRREENSPAIGLVPPPPPAPAVPNKTVGPTESAKEFEDEISDAELLTGIPDSARAAASNLAGGVFGDAAKLLVPGGPMPPTSAAPPWVKWASLVISAAARFVITLIMLRLSLKWLQLPSYLPDLIAVAGLYVVMREGLHVAGGLGGAWEFLRLFKVADLAGFVALAVFLFRFHVALNGITALKLTVITKTVTYVLMLGVGLATAFGLMAFY